ncbi:O-linked N-acetylglucosamine transferase [Nisaea sp.]|uniref:O-linked N-acetylglucosamine transferase, SPINDLY family protein n=2 Tax=Alphaproteobacteria TaxID=28211 RepID=UPI003266FA70
MDALLQTAQAHAQAARFTEFLALCTEITAGRPNDLTTLLDVGALLSSFGFVSSARECFEQARAIAPRDLRAVVNLANLSRDCGDHKEARSLYISLLESLPNHPVIQRNVVVSLEYDPDVPDEDRIAAARAWGDWSIAQAAGLRKRPPRQPYQGRPLRVGYVSADFCQHTVGLFVKDVIKAHDPVHVNVFAYSAGHIKDWVTEAVSACCRFRNVAALDDTALADLIRADKIDVLVDLSGHTSGSRLTMFAHRPAPVMVSWLGYFATTGLPYMDAVLLDEWHAPAGTEKNFVEPIIRLPQRLCYTPVPWMPEVVPGAFIRNGHITFGSFNNTAKLNAGVIDLWARILSSVANSRLVLKWRTFNDELYKQEVLAKFTNHGVSESRIDLRGPSFHVDMLEEYGDIDIALDPFPFTGGLTSCEALWMGVPVITWPQSRVVSRQTTAFLHQIGLSGLVAKDVDDYSRIALELAEDRAQLKHLRSTLRQRMQVSRFGDVDGFTRELEKSLSELYTRVEAGTDEVR